MTSKLNVIIDPVERWFTYPKDINCKEKDVEYHICKDSNGDDVMITMGWATYTCDLEIGE